jgi:hypothetical protein
MVINAYLFQRVHEYPFIFSGYYLRTACLALITVVS